MKTALVVFASFCLVLTLSVPIQAQQSAVTTYAPAMATPTVRARAAENAKPQYILNTLRLINQGEPRGCSASNWDCMTNLCKADLGTTAWRGWAGCWTQESAYICYFECSIWKDTD